MRFIGNKTKLLSNIEEVVNKHCVDCNTFCDIFSGTSSVARYFKKDYLIYSNDLLFFSYCLQMATIRLNRKPKFTKLKKELKINDPVEYFNSLETDDMESLNKNKRFFQNNYSPNGNRMYITDDNALRIDYIRNTINDWYSEKLISKNEFYYLVALCIEELPYVSNTAGTYGAFNKFWDPRAYKRFELSHLEILSNKKRNKCFNDDGLKLINKIEGDILYIDPPYNERQYLPNYHLLETIAKYDDPQISGTTGQRKTDAEKTKSTFCSKKTVLDSFEQLIKNAKFKHIILSYNTDGIMNIDDIKNVMCKYGNEDTFEINYIDYKRFKSREPVNNSELKEMLIYIEKEI